MNSANDNSAAGVLPPPLLWLAALQGHMVVVTDAHGLTLWVNDMFTRVTGHGLDDLRGCTPGSVLQGPQTDPATVACLRSAVVQGQAVAGVEILNHGRDGQPIWLRLDIVPLHDARGTLTHFFSIQSDITAERRALDEWLVPVRLLREAALVGFWQRDLGTGQERWDPVCRRLWGLGDDDPVPSFEQAGRKLSAADRQALERHRDELAAGATRGEVSYTLTKPGGERHVRSVWCRQGPSVWGVLIDTSSEHALGAERARLLQALDLAAAAARFALWRHDVARGLVQWLPRDHHPFAVNSAGLSDADSILASVLPADRPAVRAARERALGTREVVELEYRVHDAHGAVRHLLTRRLGVPDDTGAVKEIVGVLIDVTAQREREMALRRLGVQQALALQALRAGCFRFDLATRRFAFDAAMLQLYGLPSAATELTLEQWLMLVHPEDRASVRQRVEALFAAPGHAPSERFRVCSPDGRTLWIETDRVPELDSEGRAVALIGTHRDVTSEVQAAAQARALADAQLAARTRAELLATLAHELRTPLNAVTGFSQLLQLGMPGSAPDPAVTRPARHIQQASEMMSRLIDDLGDLAAADAGVVPCQATSVAVQPLLVECRSWLQQRHSGAGARIRIDDDNAATSLLADPVRVRQIMLNLLGNALKYSDGTVDAGVSCSGGTVCVWVRDHGPGLEAGQLARAFEPFERLGRQHHDQPGSGLGLTVCRRLARLMGGDIEVDSAPGAGSTFTLRLPAAAGAPAPKERTA